MLGVVFRSGAQTLFRDAKAGVGAVGANVGRQNAHQGESGQGYGQKFGRHGKESHESQQKGTGDGEEYEARGFVFMDHNSPNSRLCWTPFS